jgi:lipopolysaccharide assembly outer membrane protein LptD (OstA)
MKNLIFILGLILSFSSFAQGNDVKNKQNEPKIKCDIVKINSDKNILEFNGNVSLKTDIIELENAKKIVFNQRTKEIIVTGFDEFIINGEIQIKGKAEKKILRYTIGEKTAYME